MGRRAFKRGAPCDGWRRRRQDSDVVANPVAAGLVEHPEEWPGLLAWGEKAIRVRRPEDYFEPNGMCAEGLALRIERPPARDGGREADRAEWRERVGGLVERNLRRARRELREAGRIVLGRVAVLASSFAQRAGTYEARFRVVPTFSARVRAVRERLRRVERRFRARYRVAFERWRNGERDVGFPLGSWGVVVTHGARLEVDASG